MRQTIVGIAVICLACAAYGQNPVSASVSSGRVSVGEIFHITISANGSDINPPDMQPVTEAGIELGTPSHQSSTSIRSVQGATVVVQSRTWRYPASVNREGAITVPRVPVTVDGQEYFTQPVTIEVTRSLDISPATPGQEDELSADDLAFVRAVTDKTNVYQGEPIVLRLRIYVLDRHYVNIEGPRTLPMPDTAGFYTGAQWQLSTVEQLYGRPYRVTEFNQVLYATMPGSLTIGSWRWQGAVRWHDARRRMQSMARVFTANPIPVTVLPLPAPPDNFSGAVGKFNVQAELTHTALTQGTPVRLTVVVSGEGNPSAMGAPVFPDLPWAHVAGPETDTQLEDGGKVNKVFSWLVTPLDTGEYTIPAVEFVYFAPVIKNYRTAQTRTFSVTVQPGEDAGDLIAIGGMAEAQRRRIQVFEDGLAPIITDTQLLAQRFRANAGDLSTLHLASPFASFLLAAVCFWYLRKRERLSRDTGYARRYYARNKCLKALAHARDATDAADALYRALRGFVADMMNVNEAGLTSSDVETLLHDHGADGTPADMLTRVLRACERARYAARDAGPDDVHALYDAAHDAVEQLHAALQENRR